MIALEDVDVFFGRTVALDGVTARLEPGLIGLFGPNGSGKSTLLKVLTGLLAPTGGRALIDGTPLHPAARETRAITGYAGHASGLYPELTIVENLELWARLSGTAPSRTSEMIEMTGLAERAGDRVGALSAGVTRRASVARALLHDPELLLLDEPYANVDENAADQISRAIVAWWRPGRIAIVATHGAKRVRQYATTGLVLRRGSLASHQALKQPS